MNNFEHGAHSGPMSRERRATLPPVSYGCALLSTDAGELARRRGVVIFGRKRASKVTPGLSPGAVAKSSRGRLSLVYERTLPLKHSRSETGRPVFDLLEILS